MSATIPNVFHCARKCPFAYFLMLLVTVSFVIVIYLALFHQADISPYLGAMLTSLIGVIAVLAVALHRSCLFRNTVNKDELTSQ